ncbi:hypothetical protein BDV93DRAFT_540348 [Ceratobasidium sp. AG-I]|nr:hypothetical protein BDV93DRAFT_540348 [Ceratobasidium sp. AG-I]
MAHFIRRLAALGVLAALQLQVAAFSFGFTAPMQCENLTVTWIGGTAPFHLMITPLFSTPQNITIPNSAYNGTYGSYTTTLRVTGLESQRRFLLTMSDATGFGTGGTSGLLTAGINGNTPSCNTTDPGTDFTYQLNSALQQCRPYTWEGYQDAVQPVTITGLIPLGKTFILSPPAGNSYSWTTNVAAGTNIVFIMTDAQGRQGGSTDIYTVSASGDSSCINSDSPGSTAQSTAASTATAVPSSVPSSSTNNGAIIGASIAGGAVLLSIIASLIWFFLQRKYKRNRHEEDESSIQGMNSAKRRGRSVDLLPDDQSGQSAARSPRTSDPLNGTERDANGRSVYDPEPYMLPPPPLDSHDPFAATPRAESGNFPPSASGSGDLAAHARRGSMGTTMSGMTKAQMAASMAGGSVRSHGPARFVLHTDAGEVDDDEVVELPPMYTQVQPRRGGDASASPAPPPPTAATGDGPHVNDPLRN